MRRKYWDLLRTFNLFRTNTLLDIDPENIQNQLISTRLFLVLFITSLSILLLYISRIDVTRTVTIQSPTLSGYVSFYDQYGDKSVCPCTNITVNPDAFILLRPNFHEVCTSSFNNSLWAEAIYQSYISVTGGLYNRDFRFRSPHYFQILTSLCGLANGSITEGLLNFFTTPFVSNNILSKSMFNSQIDANIDLFLSSMTDVFIRSFRALRDATNGNSLVSSTLSSLSYSLVTNATGMANDSSTWQIALRYKSYNQSACSCRDRSTCVEQAYIYTVSPYILGSYIPLFPITGIFIGCYAFEAFLQSNLMYFFDQTNVDWFSQVLRMNLSTPPKAMNASKLSRFLANSTVQSIVENIMVDQWIRNLSYPNYFDQCRPVSCKYSYSQKNDLLYMITTISALIGGLSSVLQVTVPRCVKLSRLCCFRGN